MTVKVQYLPDDDPDYLYIRGADDAGVWVALTDVPTLIDKLQAFK